MVLKTKKFLYIMKRRPKRVGANLSCLPQLEEPCMMITRQGFPTPSTFSMGA